MNKRGFLWAAAGIIVLIVVLFGIWFALKDRDAENNAVDENITISADDCSADSDCVPDDCCHAKGCVVKTKAPDCSGTYCTLSCDPGTLDCGQGSCVCENKKCKAVLS